MDMEKKMIGGISEIRTNDSVRYECQFLLNSTEISQWSPAIGDKAPWAAHDARICELHRTFLADDSWILRITAESCSFEKNLPVVRLNNDLLLRHVEESFDVSAIFFPLEWFGCRTATAGDCTPFCYKSSEQIPGGTVKYLALDGDWATPGSLIALNSTPLSCDSITGTIFQYPDPGSMDFSRSPFSDPIPETFLRQTITTRLYRCRFYTRKEMHRISGFCGVNGKFGNRIHAVSSERGKWLAKTQRLKQVTDLQGTVYTCVDRVMLEAPGDLHWAAERNGGIWTW